MHQLFLNLISNSLKFREPETKTRINITCLEVIILSIGTMTVSMIRDAIRSLFRIMGLGLKKNI